MNKIKELYLNNRVKFDCILLAILFVFNCFFYEGAYIAYIGLLALVLTENRQNGFTLIVFAIPFVSLSVPLSVGLYFACIVAYEVKHYIIAYFIDKIKPSKALLITTAIFVIFCALPIGEYNANWFIKLCAFLTIVSLFTLFTYYPKDLGLRRNLRILSGSLLLSVVYCLFYFVSPYLKDLFSETMSLGEGSMRFGALCSTVNQLAMICEISLSLIMYFVVRKEASRGDYIAFALFSVIGFTSLSKTYFILYMVLMLILIIHCFRLDAFKTLLWVTVGAMLVLCLVIIKSDFVIRYLNRFMGDDFFALDLEEKLNYLTTYRYDLWVDTLRYIGDNPSIIIYGAGLGADKVTINSPHNFFITALYNLGIIGILIYIAVIAMVIRNMKKRGIRLGKAISVPIIIFTLLFMVEDFFLFIN